MFFGQLFKRLRNRTYNQSIERSPAVIDQKASEIKHLITDHPASNKTDDLVKELHESAANYEHQLTNSSEPKHQISEPKIILFVRREARIARSIELPKLSLDLIETTLQAGNESPWLHHDKALTLYMMGQHVEAIKILSTIEKESNGEKIKNSIYQNIEILEIY